MFTVKGPILLHPILGTRRRHRTVNFSYVFNQSRKFRKSQDFSVWGSKGKYAKAQGPSPEALVSLSHSLA